MATLVASPQKISGTEIIEVVQSRSPEFNWVFFIVVAAFHLGAVAALFTPFYWSSLVVFAVMWFFGQNVDAMAPESLYGPAASLAPEENLEFLRRCVERFREVNFADQASGRIYLSMLSGIPVWVDRQQLEGAAANPDSRAALHALAPAAFDGTVSALGTPKFLANAADAGMAQTLGRWGIRT